MEKMQSVDLSYWLPGDILQKADKIDVYKRQLQNRYPDNQWEEILGGCDFSIFLGCNDMTTATYYSDRTGEITVSVASIRKNFFTIRATDYVPEYSESRSIGKRQLLLPDEILRYPLDQGILIIRGHNVLRFKKMDYTCLLYTAM